jgi:GNAT superfamily N-acetyltransferase
MMRAALDFLPVDWPSASALCVAFRRDAWLVSYGNTYDFSELDTLKWFDALANNHPQGFLHVWQAGKIIGQIEYCAPLIRADGGVGAYINLFYLLSDQRGKGFGAFLHDYVMTELRAQGCQVALLRVIVGNVSAERFYAKHGWQAAGEIDEKGAQLLRRTVI